MNETTVVPLGLDELERLMKYFDDRRIRAADALSRQSQKQWCFAIAGMLTENPPLSLANLGEIRAVAEPPGEVELAGALKNAAQFSAVGRYSAEITHELAVNAGVFSSETNIHGLGWWLISVLRIKTLAEFLVPVMADHSWATIAAIRDNSCTCILIEDSPQTRPISVPIVIRQADADWAVKNLLVFARMFQTPKFQLAVDSLATHQHLVNPRMMIASLWAGLEAIIGIQSELRFRLSLSLACLLEPRGEERTKRYRHVKKMYDFRSKAVHGNSLAAVEMLDHVREARKLLSDVLCHMIELGKVLTDEEIELLVLE